MESRTLYVYYKVPEAEIASARHGVQQLLRQVAEQWRSLSVQVMQRPSRDNSYETWMEIYAMDGGVSDQMQTKIEELIATIPSLARYQRHTEVFVPLRLT